MSAEELHDGVQEMTYNCNHLSLVTMIISRYIKK